MTMTESEKVHFLTEGIYRNLIDNFNPGIRHLISTGRAFQKALHNVASAGKIYIDCIYSLAQTGQICKGATSEIGHALLQIAEVHKEINTQVIDNIKSFHAELLIPLETKQDGEFKQVASTHKKYLAGHKFHTGPLDKAQSALKKHRKKHKNAKYGFDQKDMQISREVRECQIKLDDYRIHNLRQALLEERKRYTFLLDRICAMVRNYASHHSKAHELLTHRLQEWSSLCKNTHVLPESSEQVIRLFKIRHDDVYNNPDDMAGNMDYADPGPQDNGSVTYGRSPVPSLTYGTSSMYHHKAEPDYGTVNRNMATPKTPTRKLIIQVRAVYNHQGSNETQLDFSEGDIITLIGEARDGWQYGENKASGRMGWFPVTFTQPLDDGSVTLGHQRVRSLGNLADLSTYQPRIPSSPMGEPPDGSPDSYNDMTGPLQRSHTITERPTSLYASRQSLAQSMANTKMTYEDRSFTTDGIDGMGVRRSQTVPLGMAPINNSQDLEAIRSLSSILEELSSSSPKRNPDALVDNPNTTPKKEYPGSVPDMSMMGPRDHYASSSPPPSGPPPPAPPPPPPPPPPPLTGAPHHMAPPTSQPGTPRHHLAHVISNPAMLPSLMGGRGFTQDAPLPPPPPQLGDYGTVRSLGQQLNSTTPSPPQSSSGYSGSSNRANLSNHSGSGSHYSGYGGGASTPQAPPFPPPPPAPPLPPANIAPATSDYEEEPSRDNPFANAKLKKTETNDRSKPRIF